MTDAKAFAFARAFRHPSPVAFPDPKLPHCMSWYYAENNERRGPIEDAAFQSLVAAGAIKPDTLVWRDGMPDWVPFSQAGYQPPAQGTAAVSGEPMGVCSESGRILPRSELIEIDGRLVSAEYKEVVLQRIREGVGASGVAADPEVLEQQILARGYDINIGSCISRAWALVRGNFWLAAGGTFLIYFIMMAAGIIPLGSIVVQGPLIGGLYWMLLKLIRREPAAVGDAFQGFSRGWGHLIAVALLSVFIPLLFILPGALTIVAGAAGRKDANFPVVIVGGILAFAGFLVMIYLVVGWIFALLLVVDKRIEFWPAMKLSRRVVGIHWWQIFGLLFVTGMIIFAIMFIGMLIVGMIAGLLANAVGNGSPLAFLVPLLTFSFLIVGMFCLLPISFCTITVAYEDIFGAPETH
jgi:hypothetical protein